MLKLNKYVSGTLGKATKSYELVAQFFGGPKIKISVLNPAKDNLSIEIGTMDRLIQIFPLSFQYNVLVPLKDVHLPLVANNDSDWRASKDSPVLNRTFVYSVYKNKKQQTLIDY